MGYIVILHNQPLILPSPTGSYKIGRAEFDWIRQQSYGSPFRKIQSKKGKLLIWVWYPSDKTEPKAPFLPAAWVKAHNKNQGIGKFIEYNFSLIKTHSYEDAPVSNDQSMYPVIIMLPGMGPAIPDYTGARGKSGKPWVHRSWNKSNLFIKFNCISGWSCCNWVKKRYNSG